MQYVEILKFVSLWMTFWFGFVNLAKFVRNQNISPANIGWWSFSLTLFLYLQLMRCLV